MLKTNHLFGSLKKFKDNYSEIIDGDINNDIFEKIKEKKIFELFNIHNSKIEEPEENVFKPEINDLLLEEGVKKIIEKDEENNNFPPFYMHNLDDEN